MAGPVLAAEGLVLEHGGRAVVDQASFHVEAGWFLALVGPNGGGKTTLLRALAGLHPLAQGQLTWALPRPRLGYLAQKTTPSDPLFPATVEEVVALGLHPSPTKRTGAEEKKQIAKVVDLPWLLCPARPWCQPRPSAGSLELHRLLAQGTFHASMSPRARRPETGYGQATYPAFKSDP